MAKNDLFLKLGLETKAASKAMDRFQRDTKASLDQITGSFNLLKGVAVAAVGVFAGRKLLGALGDVTQAAITQQDAVNQLNSALKLAGDFSSDASQSMQDFASDLQQVTGIGDETTIKMLGLAKSFNTSNDEAQRLVEAAADLAEVSGMSLDSAVRNLGKSLSGLAGELGESVAGMRDLTKRELENGAAIDLILDRYGGAAASRLNTFSGSLEAMEGAFGDLKESIGEIIIENPVLIDIIKQMKSGFESLTKIVKDNKDDLTDGLSGALIAIAEKGPDAVDTLADISLAAIKTAKVFNEFTGAVLMGFKDILTAGDNFASFFKLLTDPINTFVLGMVAIQGTVAEMQLDSAKDDLSDLKDEFNEMEKALKNNERAVPIEEYKAMRREIALAEADVAGLESEVNTLAKTGELVAVDIDVNANDVEKEIQAQIDARVQTDLDLSEAEKDVEAMRKSAKEMAKASVQSLKAAREQAKVQEKAVESTEKAMTDLLDKMKDAGKAIGKELLGNILKGAKGAETAVANLGGAAVEAFLPGFGGAATAFLTELINLSPDQVKAQVEAFVDALPVIIDAIAESMPIVAIALAENADKIIIALVTAIPTVAVKLAESMPMVAVELANAVGRLVGDILRDLGDGFQFVIDSITDIDLKKEVFGGLEELGDEFSRLAEVYDTIVGAFQDLLDGINRATGSGDRGFATGGSDLERALGINGAATGGLVAGSSNADTELFRLKPGELVVPDRTTDKLQNFLDGRGAGGNSEMMTLLMRIATLLEKPQTVEIQQEFNGQAFADIILTLNRSNARLA